MAFVSQSSTRILALSLVAAAATGSFAARAQDPAAQGSAETVVYGPAMPDPATMAEGPDVEGIISARSGNRIQVTATDGSRSVLAVDDATQVTGKGGFLGLGSSKLTAASLVNGLPVTIETKQAGDALYASKVKVKTGDLKTAAMIHNGTDQRFAQNEAATEALRGRMGDIDQYDIKGTTNVNFDTGKANLSPEAKQNLCQAAMQADGMDNALLLVVGYTDSTGSQELNQALSEKRAGNVVNYLQQACHWKPYRMLTPTGMSEADPVADNMTSEGKAQNRRVAVNILVSKAVEGI